MMAAAALGGATSARADQNPDKCTGNNLVLNIAKDKTLVRNGDVVTYTVSVANDAAGACNITDATVVLTLPAPNGTATGTSYTLATNASYDHTYSLTVIGSKTYTAALNPGVSNAIAKVTVTGTLHDAPINDTADIVKTVGANVTQPHMTLTKTAYPTAGVAPLPVVYTYTLVNDSSTDVVIEKPTISDNLCSPVTYVSGDTNGDGNLQKTETWVLQCGQTFTTAGTFVNTATATGTSSVDHLPVPAGPVQASVTVTVPAVATPTPTPPPAPTPTPVAPPSGGVKGATTVNIPSINSPAAKPNAACVELPSKLSVRAGETNVIRVHVGTSKTNIKGAVVKITGPGFTKTAKTDSKGIATFTVKPKTSGKIVVQSNQCLGADRATVLAARKVVSRQVPQVTG